ncbi:MAG: tRNA pseudouridine(55) synthase TruB [Gammaproteobacteria bacterium]
MAKRRRHNGRDVNGIVLLDKPQGLTSNQALQKVKRIFRANKAGHTGSLDPLATGMLPICLGEATKVSGFLLDADKRYHATCTLGIRTDTADADGEVISTRPVGDYSDPQIREILARFTGEQRQIPPMYSALKRDGVPLYKLARQGIEIEREARTIAIHELVLLERGQDTLVLDIHCSKGTYVRTLADDIGEALGCGAHIAALRRQQVGVFDPSSMVTLEQLNTLQEQGVAALDDVLLPVEAGLANWPDVRLTADASVFLQQGQAVFIPQIKYNGFVRLYLPDGGFMGVGRVLDDGRIAPKRLMNQTKIG